MEKGQQYFIGIEDIGKSEKLRDNLRSSFSDEHLDVNISLRKGCHLCGADGEGRSCVNLGGVSLLEFRSRAIASSTKVNLITATRDELRADMEEQRIDVNELEGLEHFYIWIRAHNFPAAYSMAELGNHKYHTLYWLGQNLAAYRRIGSFQLCVIGPADLQNTLFSNICAFCVPPCLFCSSFSG